MRGRAQLGKSLPESVSDDMLQDEGFLRNLHHVLLEVHIESGSLICPESGRYDARGPPTPAVRGGRRTEAARASVRGAEPVCTRCSSVLTRRVVVVLPLTADDDRGTGQAVPHQARRPEHAAAGGRVLTRWRRPHQRASAHTVSRKLRCGCCIDHHVS